MAFYVTPIDIKSDYWTPAQNKNVLLSEVEHYFNIKQYSLYSIKDEKFNFIFKSDDVNKFEAIKQYMYYVWDLINNINQLNYKLDEDEYSVEFFSKWCYNNGYTGYVYQAREWIITNSCIILEYDIEPYLRFDIRYIKPDGILQNILKGYEQFQQDIVWCNYNPTKIYI